MNSDGRTRFPSCIWRVQVSTSVVLSRYQWYLKQLRCGAIRQLPEDLRGMNRPGGFVGLVHQIEVASASRGVELERVEPVALRDVREVS